MGLDNSAINDERENSLNQGTVTVEVHTQLINCLSNRKFKKDLINHPLIHATLIIIAMEVTVGNQISASDVDRKIISFQIVQNQTLWLRHFTGTQKILKLVHID